MSCKIKKNLLVVPCSKYQESLRSKKCYKNKCYVVNKVLDTGNKYGNINVIDNGTLIVKWNKRPITDKKKLNDIIMEIKNQNFASVYNLSPKIKKFYIHDRHIFMIMDNLYYYGYEPLLKNYKNYKNDALKALYKKMTKLHEIGIYHGDMHLNNIFYNKKTNDIMLLDYGFSKPISKDANKARKQITKDIKKFMDIVKYFNA